MKSLSKRTNNFTDSVIRRMTSVSKEAGAINLSQGFPDFAPPKKLLESLAKTASLDAHQYSPAGGESELRRAIAEKVKNFMGLKVDAESEIVVSCGSTEALIASMMSIVDPEDIVAIFSPYYENYWADTVLTGSRPVYIPLSLPSLSFDRNLLEDVFKKGAKVLILCNPSNPTGKVFTREELEDIAYIVNKYDGYVITDEVYEHIIYPENEHTYISSLSGMRERTVSCSSLSKTFSITGWRLGYTIASKEITERIKKVHDFLTIGAPTPLQKAVITALNFGSEYYKELKDLYLSKKNLFLSGLDSIGLKYIEPQGAYYTLVDIEEFGYESDVDFALDLANKIKVGAVPGSIFFEDRLSKYIRFHFAKNESTLLEALSRLEGIKKLRK